MIGSDPRENPSPRNDGLELLADSTDQRAGLEADIREFFLREEEEWEDEDEMLGSELWDTMPAVDSKAVARTAGLFKRWLGKPLDVRLIRQGGYDNVDDMINHLVPKMMDGIATPAKREAAQ